MPTRLKEDASFNSSRVQRASRINGIEQGRLCHRLHVLDRQRLHSLRLANQDIRMVGVTMDYIQTCSGHSAEGLPPDFVDTETRSSLGPCFLYGERQGSRKYAKMRHLVEEKRPGSRSTDRSDISESRPGTSMSFLDGMIQPANETTDETEAGDIADEMSQISLKTRQRFQRNAWTTSNGRCDVQEAGQETPRSISVASGGTLSRPSSVSGSRPSSVIGRPNSSLASPRQNVTLKGATSNTNSSLSGTPTESITASVNRKRAPRRDIRPVTALVARKKPPRHDATDKRPRTSIARLQPQTPFSGAGILPAEKTSSMSQPGEEHCAAKVRQEPKMNTYRSYPAGRRNQAVESEIVTLSDLLDKEQPSKDEKPKNRKTSFAQVVNQINIITTVSNKRKHRKKGGWHPQLSVEAKKKEVLELKLSLHEERQDQINGRLQAFMHKYPLRRYEDVPLEA